MLKNYLKTAFRSMLRTKGYSFINLAGLAIGLTCCLIILQFVAFEFSFDRFHENEDDLYRVLQAYASGDEDMGLGGAFTGFALGPTLEQEVPEVLRATRMHPEFAGAVVSPVSDPIRVFEESEVLYTDPNFLKMFSFPLIAGSAEMRPGTVLLTESAARRYFDAENPIGELLSWSGATERTYLIAGVLKDVPAASHLQFQFILPIEDLLTGSEQYVNEPENGWSYNNFATYLQLRPGTDVEAAEHKMTGIYLAHRADELREWGFRGALRAQPLRDVHLNADTEGEPLNAVLGSYRTVYFFMVIGIITLLIALFNYVNLATARALDRAREVGVRKTVGARQRQLIWQFLFESGLTNAAAAAVAVALAIALTPLVDNFAGVRLTTSLWADPVFWAAFSATLVLATLLAGLYPAFVLSSFRPIAVLKGTGGSSHGRVWLRKSLVVAQFGLSVALMGGTVVVYDQLTYMREMDLGLETDQIVTVTGPRVLSEGTDNASATGTLLQELRRLPGVRKAASSASIPGGRFNWMGASFYRAEEGPSSRREGVVAYIDTSFADLFGLTLVAGRELGANTLSDDDDEDAPWPVMANEKTVRTLGFASPQEAVGRPIVIGDYEASILGVYADFNWSSAHEERQNIFFGYTPGGRHVSMHIDSADIAGTMAAVERVYERLFPGNVFNYTFMDEAFDRLYHTEERFARLFTLFAGLAVMIACLGLFGLASFTARQRTREIGVRKVLGASVSRLVGMLARDFLVLVAIATAIGLPVAYLLMQRWLGQFAYRVDIHPRLFVAVVLVTFFIATGTVAYQSIKTALADPVKSLQVE